MDQPDLAATTQLEHAFEAFNRVSKELDVTYHELESKVAELTVELSQSRSARLRELAEKERLANRLSTLVSALPGGVLIIDKHQMIKDANPESRQLLGEPLTGNSLQAVMQREGIKFSHSSRELQLSSGKRISIVSRQLDSLGDQVVLITDITEMHCLQEQLAQKKRLSALGEMSARLAHQIRTPLSATSLYLSQLGRNDISAKQRQRVSLKVRERLNHMGNLLESMLCFVRGETTSKEIVLINSVLQSLEQSVRPHLELHNASLSIPFVDSTLKVSGNGDELTSALCNLVMNSLDATPDMAAIELWVGALSKDKMLLRYRDNGPGIKEEVIDHIFDPFFTTRANGTGLGLAVVARTVANLEGEISVGNRPEGGVEFNIVLPITAAQET